jgi:putative sterol carrier protein
MTMADQPDLMQLTEGSDDEVAQKIRDVGTEDVLGGVFAGMQERFQPDRASGVDAQVQWLVSDEGEEHPYVITIKDGSCETGPGRSDNPRVTLSTDLASFAKLMAGKTPGPALYMGGKLQIQGDLMLAQRMTTFFSPAGG